MYIFFQYIEYKSTVFYTDKTTGLEFQSGRFILFFLKITEPELLPEPLPGALPEEPQVFCQQEY